jgi:hypothetical protein
MQSVFFDGDMCTACAQKLAKKIVNAISELNEQRHV